MERHAAASDTSDATLMLVAAAFSHSVLGCVDAAIETKQRRLVVLTACVGAQAPTLRGDNNPPPPGGTINNTSCRIIDKESTFRSISV